MSPNADAIQDPLAFLQWSMERYQALTSFQAECLWRMDTGLDRGQTQKPRTLQYVKPNRYRVVSGASPGYVQVSICDGKKAVDYTLSPQQEPKRYPAPPSIADANTTLMRHYMFCGSLLYPFFGGPDKLYALADTTQEEVQFGSEVLLDGYECRTVRFVAMESYGQTEIAISVQDGLVRRICYGNEPLIEMIQTEDARMWLKIAGEWAKQKIQQGALQQAQLPDGWDDFDLTQIEMPPSLPTTETYTHLIVNAPIPDEVFEIPAFAS